MNVPRKVGTYQKMGLPVSFDLAIASAKLASHLTADPILDAISFGSTRRFLVEFCWAACPNELDIRNPKAIIADHCAMTLVENRFWVCGVMISFQRLCQIAMVEIALISFL